MRIFECCSEIILNLQRFTVCINRSLFATMDFFLCRNKARVSSIEHACAYFILHLLFYMLGHVLSVLLHKYISFIFSFAARVYFHVTEILHSAQFSYKI